MPNDRIIDEVDLRILHLLQENARVPQVEIARDVGLAPSAVLERIRKLEARGAIRGYTAIVDPHALDLGMLAFIAVRSADFRGEGRVAEALAAIPEVLEVHHVAGEDCFFLKIRARDAERLGRLLRTRLAAITAVTSTRTTIVLETTKETPRLPFQARGSAGAAS
jgi:Lrp/AsnC family leucine-responsive transcriptional regulator